MNLNHINLTFADIPAARHFFEKYFDFKVSDPKPNDALSVLTGENGVILVLMNERMNEDGNNGYPDNFHIGFYLESEKEVDEIYEKLKTGMEPVGERPKNMRKTYGFYIKFQRVLIEITTANVRVGQ